MRRRLAQRRAGFQHLAVPPALQCYQTHSFIPMAGMG